MKEQFRIPAWLFLILLIPHENARAVPLKLWYGKSAKTMTEALPIGNGRIGAMVYGGTSQERFSLNEHSVWSGGPSRNDNPDALEALPIVRQWIFEGRFEQAQDLANQKIIAKNMHGAAYQPVGSLFLAFPGHDRPTGYRRELDLERAVAATEYTMGGVRYRREAFASIPDQVIAVRLTADRSASIAFTLSVDSPQEHRKFTEGTNRLMLSGASGPYGDIPGQVRFLAITHVLQKGGTASATDSTITVLSADEATLIISMSTNVVDYRDISADPAAVA
ncbi:MAG TPA: glycoside hydrolase family 95 protein, partial [bacterium]